MTPFSFGDVVYLDDGNHLWSIRACYPASCDIVRGSDGKLLTVFYDRLSLAPKTIQQGQGRRLLNVPAYTL